MAKEFKDFDRKYMGSRGTVLQPLTDTQLRTVANIVRWGQPIRSWSAKQIRTAVYDSFDAEEWQKFRVALKGLSTAHKLFRLLQYRHNHAQYDSVTGFVIPEHIQCRVDNYVNALKRGGQLDSEGNIVR